MREPTIAARCITRHHRADFDAKEDAARRELEDLNQALVKSQNALKDVGGLAHDVRTPMSSLKIGLSRLEEEQIDMPSLGRALRSEVEYLDALFANLVSLVRIEANSRTITVEATEMGGLMKQLINRFQVLAEDKGIQLAYSAPESVVFVRGDSVDLEQAMGNVVYNSIKYAHENVAVLVDRTDTRVVITVRDDGPGFLEDELHQVKERFFSGEVPPLMDDKVWASGLTIVDDIVHRIDGDFRIKNHAEGAQWSRYRSH